MDQTTDTQNQEIDVQKQDLEAKNQALREAAEKHDKELFSEKYKMHEAIYTANAALDTAERQAKELGGRPGAYITYPLLARMMEYKPSDPDEVLSATTMTPMLVMKLINAFEQDPAKLDAFKAEMDQKYKSWEKWYLENGDTQKRTNMIPNLAHNDESWQREIDALMSSQILINNVYAELFSVFQFDCEIDDNINAAMKAITGLSKSALPNFPDVFNPSPTNRPCFANQMKDLNKYFRAIFSRAHHINRKKYQTLEGFLYHAMVLELENIHDMMYANAREVAKADMLFWTATNN